MSDIAEFIENATILGISRTQGDRRYARLSPSMARVPWRTNLNAIGLGDSITAGTGTGNPQHFDLACQLTGGKVKMFRNAGVGGQTTTQMLARLQSDVLADKPDIVSFLGSINDVLQDVPLATSKSNVRTIVERSLNSGSQVVIGTIMPQGSTATRDRILQRNAYYYEIARYYGIPIVDHYSNFVDISTGYAKSGYLYDGTHPTVLGVRTLADALSPVLVSGTSRMCYLVCNTTDPNTLLANGLFTSTSGGIPTNWNLTNDANNTWSAVSGDTNILGNWLRLTKTAGSTVSAFQNVTTGFSVGDRLRLSFRWRSSGMEAGGMCIRAQLTYTGSGQTDNAFFNWGADYSPNGGLVAEVDAVVPSGATAVQVRFFALPISGSDCSGLFDVAQATLINRTTGGLIVE